MANDKIVPVVIKLTTENDNSLDGAIAQAKEKLKGIATDSATSINDAVVTAADKTAKAVQRAIRPETMQIYSENAISKTISAINEINAKLSDSSQKFQNITSYAKAAFDAGIIAADNEAIVKLNAQAGLLANSYKAVAAQLIEQRTQAEKLSLVAPADFVGAKAQLQSAQILTRSLQDEAKLIERSYRESFDSVQKKIKDVVAEQEKALKEADRLAAQQNKKTDTSVPLPTISTTRQELELIRIRGQIVAQQNEAEARKAVILQQQLDVQKQITLTKNAETKDSLSGRYNDAVTADQRAVDLRRQAAIELGNLQKSVEQQIAVARAGGTADEIKSLKLAAEQSRVTASLLIADARKIETEYKTSFGKLAADAEKAGREIVENVKNPKIASGSSNSAFGFLAPLTNQLAGLTDSFIGSLGSKLGFLRTTVGTQLGISLGRGVSDGLNSVDLSESNVSKFLKSLDEPSKQLISNIGSGIVVACAAASAAIGGLIVSVTQVAGKFEGFIAQLTTSFKDPTLAVNRFKEAVELASKTPFDVEQVVRAQVSLAARGEKSLAVLKDVTELAAAQNKDLNETAVAVGHATEGSVRGYEQLRNSYGVTTARLKEFGAVVDSQNRILVHNEYQIQRNKEALLQLIRADFGGGVERLSQTLIGLQSNLRDEVTKLSASFGNVFLPTMKVATQLTTDFVNKLNEIPQEMKILLGGALAAAGGFAALVTSLGATYLAVTQVQKVVQSLLLVEGIQNILVLNGALEATSFIVGGLGKAVVFIASILPQVAALTAVVVALSAGFKSYEEQQRLAGDNIQQLSKDFAEARRSVIGLDEDIKKTFQLPDKFKLDIKDSQHALEQIKGVLQEKGSLGAVADLTAAGVTAEDLQKQIEVKRKAQDRLKESADSLNEYYRKLAEIQKSGIFTREKINDTIDGAQVITTYNLTVEDTVKNQEQLNKVLTATGFKPDTIVDAKNIAEIMNAIANNANQASRAIGSLNLTISQSSLYAEQFKKVTSGYGAIEAAFNKAEASTKLALRIKDSELLLAAQKKEELSYISIKDKIQALQSGAEVTSASLAELSASGNTAGKSLVDAFYKSRESLLQLAKARAELPREITRQEIENIDLTTQYRLATSKKSEHEIKLNALQESREKVAGSYDAYKLEAAHYLETRENINNAKTAKDKDQFLSELEFSKIRLDSLRIGAKEEIKIIRETQTEENAIRAQTIAHTKDAIKDLINSIKQQASGEKPLLSGVGGFDGDNAIVGGLSNVKKIINEAGSEALTADEKLKIYQKGLESLNKIADRADIKKLRAESTELNGVFREAARTLDEGITKARIDKPIENFKNLKLVIGETVSNTNSLQDKIKAIDVAEEAIRIDRQKGLINNKDAEKEILELEKQRHEAQKGITAAVEAQNLELSKLRDKQITDEIKILEIKKQTAQGVNGIAAIESEITNRKRQQVQAEFQTLAQEQAKELAEKNTGKDRELVLEKYREKESAIIRNSYLEYAKAEEDKLKAFQDRLKSEQAEVDKYKEKRIGGKNSPIISLEELAFQSSLPGFGSDLYSDKSQPFDRNLQYNLGSARPGGGQILTYEQYKAKFTNDNRLKSGTGEGGTKLPGAADDIKPITSPTQTINTYNVNINGSGTTDQDIIKRASDLAQYASQKKASTASLLSGPTSGSLAQPAKLGVGEYPKLVQDPQYPSSYIPGL